MNFDVKIIYKVKHTEPFSITSHRHRYWEMVLYNEGKGTVDVEASHYEYEKDSLIIVPSEQEHNEVNLKESHNLVVCFNTEGDGIPTGHFKATPFIVSLLHNILDEYTNPRKSSEEIINLGIKTLFLTLSRTESEKIKRKDFFSFLKDIDNFIIDNRLAPIRIEDIAQMYNYSPDRFRHIFTEKTGISPKQYIISKRLEYAKKLLTSTKMSVTNIAQECGFYDVSQFSRLFFKKYKTTPSNYRTENKKALPKILTRKS